MGQMAVVYAFVADIAVFKFTVNHQELLGASIILLFNLLAVKNKLKK